MISELVTMKTPPVTTRLELKFKICAPSCSRTPLSTVNGTLVPKLFKRSVFSVLVAPRIVRFVTVMAAGKLPGVDGLIATAFQTELVIRTDCELFGRIPSDQFVASSQLPL